jgi:hypothetical protein
MKLFVCIYDDLRLLPHFLRHYDRFDVTEFHVATPPELASDVLRASSDYRVTHYTDLDVEDSFLGGAAAVSEMRRLAQGPEEWVVIVDLDEFVEFGEPVARIVTRLDREGANVAQGVMFDRFAEDGQPKAFYDDTVIAELFPVRARFIKIVQKGFDRKAVLVKGHLKNRVANHVFHDQKLSKTRFDISHYKWNDRALKRVRSAYEMLTANQAPWADEYKRILDHYDENGRFAWEAFEGEFAADAVPSSSGAWAR